MSEDMRRLPSVNTLLEAAPDLVKREGRARAVYALRRALDDARAAMRSGAQSPTQPQLIASATNALAASAIHQNPTSVINATGVIIHTNLGRAPLSDAAQRAMQMALQDYSPLEFDLASGERGKRGYQVAQLMREITDAEDTLVVNNCASATMLMLTALAKDKGVVIARGQLVEIGGGFRVPDIMQLSGARLIEIGATNKVRASDYADAIHNNTDVAALLRVHPSNFKLIGFTQEVSIEEMARVAAHTPLLDDLGSGALLDTAQFRLSHEPMVQESIAAGAAAVCFSGDKLLGGPQAGIIAGKRAALERIRKHPLARALRADKGTLAALAATLLHYARGEALSAIPIWRMIALPLDEIERRARHVADALRGWGEARGVQIDLVNGTSTIGGGSLPGEALPTWLIALRSANAADLAAELRAADVIARIQDERVLLDLRTVMDDVDLIQKFSN